MSDNNNMGNNLNRCAAWAQFQNKVKDWFCKNQGAGFELEKEISIGNPPKAHKFDIVNIEKKVAIECKSYTWTKIGNVPNAKIDALIVATFYLLLLPDEYDKYIVIKHSCHLPNGEGESLAEYYYRTCNHLIGKIKIAEYNPKNDKLELINP